MSAWDELGGRPSTIQPPKTATAEPSTPTPPVHVHSFDRVSGWCGACGKRDDGRTDR